MMRKCSITGCTSHKSEKKKDYCFTIPKSPKTLEAWQKAFGKPGLVLKPNQPICRKHFSKSDINVKRFLKSSDGVTLGVSPYARIKLKEGAMPKHFSIPDSSDDEDEEENVGHPKKPVRMYSTIKKQANGDVESSQVAVYTFEDIVKDNTIAVPSSWTKNVLPCGNETIVAFALFKASKEKGKIKTLVHKEVIVLPDLKFEVHILGQYCNIPSHFGQRIKSKLDLEKILEMIDSHQICQGCMLPKDLRRMQCNLTYVDLNNTLRHMECSILTDDTQCKLCKHVCKFLKQKQLSSKQGRQRMLRMEAQKVKEEEVKGEDMEVNVEDVKQEVVLDLEFEKKEIDSNCQE